MYFAESNTAKRVENASGTVCERKVLFVVYKRCKTNSISSTIGLLSDSYAIV